MQAVFQGVIPADNLTFWELLDTGGPTNYPYVTYNPNNPEQAVGAPTEQLVQFLYPSDTQAALQKAIDSSAASLSAFGAEITAITLTQPPCAASDTGVCAPGVLLLLQKLAHASMHA